MWNLSFPNKTCSLLLSIKKCQLSSALTSNSNSWISLLSTTDTITLQVPDIFPLLSWFFTILNANLVGYNILISFLPFLLSIYAFWNFCVVVLDDAVVVIVNDGNNPSPHFLVTLPSWSSSVEQLKPPNGLFNIYSLTLFGITKPPTFFTKVCSIW